MQTHTHLAVLDKDNGLGNNLQSHFSFEDIYGETDHYSCNAPTNAAKKKTRMKDNKSTDNKDKGQRKENENEKSNNVGYGLPGADDKFVLARVKGQL